MACEYLQLPSRLRRVGEEVNGRIAETISRVVSDRAARCVDTREAGVVVEGCPDVVRCRSELDVGELAQRQVGSLVVQSQTDIAASQGQQQAAERLAPWRHPRPEQCRLRGRSRPLSCSFSHNLFCSLSLNGLLKQSATSVQQRRHWCTGGIEE